MAASPFADDEEDPTKKPGAADAVQPTPPPTFAQLQQRGMPRPPSPVTSALYGALGGQGGSFGAPTAGKPMPQMPQIGPGQVGSDPSKMYPMMMGGGAAAGKRPPPLPQIGPGQVGSDPNRMYGMSGGGGVFPPPFGPGANLGQMPGSLFHTPQPTIQPPYITPTNPLQTGTPWDRGDKGSAFDPHTGAPGAYTPTNQLNQSNLEGYLYDMLSNPTATPTYQNTMKQIGSGIDTDAAKRGVYYSTIPTGSYSQAGSNLAAGLQGQAYNQLRGYNSDYEQLLMQLLGAT